MNGGDLLLALLRTSNNSCWGQLTSDCHRSLPRALSDPVVGGWGEGAQSSCDRKESTHAPGAQKAEPRLSLSCLCSS